MRPGWYILNYHNVDWEDPILTQAIGVTTRPDVFRTQLDALAKEGRFVSIPEGRAMLDAGHVDEVLFSLWFDDGYSGLRENVAPICESLGITPALSLNARFTLRKEMFWRAKLAYLAHVDALRFVRARLRRSFDGVPFKIRTWTLEHFSTDLLSIIDEHYEEHASEAFRRDAFRIFASEGDIAALAASGWTMANHGAGHWPLAPELGWDAVEREFDECESFVRRFSSDNRYWVIPFAYGSEHYRDRLMQRATVVEVGERRNTTKSWRETGRLFRFDAPMHRDVVAALY